MKKLGQGLLILLFTLFVWQMLSLLLASPVLPKPGQILQNFAHTIGGRLPIHIVASFLRVACSMLAALAFGIPLGVAMGYSPRLNRLFSPLLYLSYPIPKLALLPVMMLLFGLGEISKIIMIFLILFFPVTVDIAGSVRAMDKEIFQTMRAFGAKDADIVRRIVLPGIMPAILVSLKVSVGIALSILFFAENYGTQHGLGYLIMTSWQKMDYVNLYTGIFTLSLLGFFIFLFLDWLEDRATVWK